MISSPYSRRRNNKNYLSAIWVAFLMPKRMSEHTLKEGIKSSVRATRNEKKDIDSYIKFYNEK